MESLFYLKTNFTEATREIFFDEFVKQFYDEIDGYCLGQLRNHSEYHIAEYGEMTLLNFFINGIVRNDSISRYNLLNEFGMDRVEGDKIGRADLIIEDTVCLEQLYIEAKKEYSDAKTPEIWNHEETKSYYRSILDQANKYLEADIQDIKDESKNKFFKIALVFDSVRFTENDVIGNWLADELLDNEFYAIKTYPSTIPNYSSIGLACYGIIEEYKNNLVPH
ncbi:hypothetical protein [Draconibacterium orientale]|uniref:hypothetical protein n=1 Tax=Draconibacterium orientale TaxID=1168034 RepID=UPI0029C0EB0B|nr:hypothetical protein [Draconibacterium orientale]